jgi:hypothetical protein
MHAQSDIHAQTVRLLRDISRNHAAAAADMCRGSEQAPPDAPPEQQPRPEPPAQELEDLGAMLRELEDVGLSALCRLARVSDPEDAFLAIDEAGAGWLREVILNRAVETVPARRR